MKTELACLPCFFEQVARTLRYAGVNGDRGRAIARKAEAIIEASPLDEVPARTTTLIHRLLRGETGVDPYKTVKDAYNRIARDTLSTLERLAAGSPDRLEGGVRAAIAGNVIDFGVYERIDLDRAIEESFRSSLTPHAYGDFTREVRNARRVLYLCDNAGEIMFDRLLLERLKEMDKDLTVAVKGSPVINDATLEDAAAAELREYATVIDNGNDGVGTLLESCSPRFLDAYRSADLIVSKGQANYETLADTKDERLFFLFKVKCRVVAEHLDLEDGALVLMRNGRS